MEEKYFIIGIVAMLASLLTFFSGFGLGTLLLPVFAVFFPLDVAIALTAVVHLLNNIFKLVITGRHFNKEIILKFGLIAVAGALAGAWLLESAGDKILLSYSFQGKVYEVMLVKLIIAIVITIFSLTEIIPAFNFEFDKKYLPVGGLFSGFFGGLSGHQGALRSMFLVKCNLTKESFIATGVLIACLIDVSRLSVYATHFSAENLNRNSGILITAILCAFAGAFAGQQLLKKVTIGFLQKAVSVFIILFALALGAGIV